MSLKTDQDGCDREQIEALIEATGVVPAVNQVERHPTFPDPDLVNYCAKKGIRITCYSVRLFYLLWLFNHPEDLPNQIFLFQALGNNLQGIPLAIERHEVKDVAAAASKRLGQIVTPAQVV